MTGRILTEFENAILDLFDNDHQHQVQILQTPSHELKRLLLLMHMKSIRNICKMRISPR
jgi:hypothetical protein